jgi:hypothetical protein
MSNVQLSEKERSVVYLSVSTGRILGFGPAGMPAFFVEDCKTETLYHAYEMDRWADKYRKQIEEEKQQADFEKAEREAPVRNAIRAALRARRAAVGPIDRRMIDVNLMLMDQREERARKRKTESFLLSESYDSSKTDHDIALDAPALKAKG